MSLHRILFIYSPRLCVSFSCPFSPFSFFSCCFLELEPAVTIIFILPRLSLPVGVLSHMRCSFCLHSPTRPASACFLDFHFLIRECRSVACSCCQFLLSFCFVPKRLLWS
ncbi:hypothetical protein BCR44DRAFT_347436 [Catenaria anguillulae PL171]|uniref:Uncharacterized protein n=1 Tax=Catenaria anguillulae PL171 TaxID=765915 RepID=A0A1Y2H805_9FUNG|nr:hypothetical protein BCR44DRAFT_347436 [Catenaria anguillulae PL171]